jgi:hypothetical protein
LNDICVITEILIVNEGKIFLRPYLNTYFATNSFQTTENIEDTHL